MERNAFGPDRMPAFGLRVADAADIPALAEMNLALIRDEGSANPMSLPELEVRMAGFLSGGYRAVMIRVDEETAGYCLYRAEPDEYGGRPGVYLRQYYIKPEHRRRGLGRAALRRIVEEEFAGAARVTLDVLECNPAGRAFWAAVGFKPHTHRLKLEI